MHTGYPIKDQDLKVNRLKTVRRKEFFGYKLQIFYALSVCISFNEKFQKYEGGVLSISLKSYISHTHLLPKFVAIFEIDEPAI